VNSSRIRIKDRVRRRMAVVMVYGLRIK